MCSSDLQGLAILGVEIELAGVERLKIVRIEAEKLGGSGVAIEQTVADPGGNDDGNRQRTDNLALGRITLMLFFALRRTMGKIAHRQRRVSVAVSPPPVSCPRSQPLLSPRPICFAELLPRQHAASNALIG